MNEWMILYCIVLYEYWIRTRMHATFHSPVEMQRSTTCCRASGHCGTYGIIALELHRIAQSLPPPNCATLGSIPFPSLPFNQSDSVQSSPVAIDAPSKQTSKQATNPHSLYSTIVQYVPIIPFHSIPFRRQNGIGLTLKCRLIRLITRHLRSCVR